MMVGAGAPGNDTGATTPPAGVETPPASTPPASPSGPDPAAPAAPAGGTPPAAPTGDTSPAGDSTTPPAKEAQGGDGAEFDPPPPSWEDFKKARYERRVYREQAEQLKGEVEQLTTSHRELEAQHEQLTTQHEQLTQRLTYIQSAFRRHPDLLQALEEREAELRRTGQLPATVAPTAEPRTQAADQMPDWAKALQKQIDDIHGVVRTGREAEAENARKAKFENTGREVVARITAGLKKYGLPEDVYLEDALDFVCARAAANPGSEPEDIPFYLSQWYRRERQKQQHRDRQYVAGKRADAGALPPSTPPASPPVQPVADMGSLDRTTKTVLEEQLRQRLGWQ